MVGHKVKCQCGFVFRLGSKADKQAWVADELKRKKALKAKKKAELKRQADAKASRLSSGVGDQEDEILNAIPAGKSSPKNSGPKGSLFDSMDDVLDAIPVAPDKPLQLTPVGQSQPLSDTNPSVFSPDEYDQDLFAAGSPQESNLQPLPVAKPIPRQKRRPRKAKRQEAVHSTALPIWNLVLTFIGLPLVLVFTFFLGRSTYNAFQQGSVFSRGPAAGMPEGIGLTLHIILGIILTLLFLALAGAMIASAITSILELSNGVQINWGTSTASTIASLVVAGIFLMFFWEVYNLLSVVNHMEELGNRMGRTIDKSKVGRSLAILAVKNFVYAIVPIAVAITGFSRTMRR